MRKHQERGGWKDLKQVACCDVMSLENRNILHKEEAEKIGEEEEEVYLRT